MVIIKKLVFAIPFLLSFIAFCALINPFLQDPNLVLSLDMKIIMQIITLALLMLSSMMFFVIFSTIAQDWRLAMPIALLVSLSAPYFLQNPAIIILAAGFLFSFGLVYFLLEKKLQNYLTFQPTKLLIPSIKQTATLILLVCSLAFYITSNNQIKTEGFKLPSSLLDLPLQFMQTPETLNNNETPNQLSISPEQLQLLKQNPEALKQVGLDPKILDQINTPTSKTKTTPQDLIKPMVEQQIQGFIKPYLQYIPLILSITFFFTLQSLVSLFSIFLSPIIWFIFWVLEKIGFTKFEIETREVKKLVV